ncbi:hypothetical protein diail_8425, partial [Diaporthe ilicicola]
MGTTTTASGPLQDSKLSSTFSSREQSNLDNLTFQDHGDKEQSAQGEGSQYVTGYKLAVVVASVALSCFLMLLDTMIIST